MGLFHKHNWYVVTTKFNPPVSKGNIKATGFFAQANLESLVYGFTTVTQRCAGCNKIDVSRYVGTISIGDDND